MICVIPLPFGGYFFTCLSEQIMHESSTIQQQHTAGRLHITVYKVASCRVTWSWCQARLTSLLWRPGK
jgi:hypothetical protein